ncbi:MAG: tetratricopeptide repeat protein [Ignavibacteria bacterium]|nr:tetratricopeptide repeat protein [Ignavibacteria bacterium]MCU7503995.1 tetratricopeptide repeat protein [Ignavibacteria bacterium]MCU7515367.1 tetratricopeptide repeat protein [Ignavibacteria bacterium]
MKQIRAGSFGEAIDLLNKYVAAYPHLSDGLNLRGFCFEKRGQYGDALLDYKRALQLSPNNSEIKKNLARAENVWNALLYKKIEGHKREIAINPNNPVNYLEIGKCMKNLGRWKEAESWYDNYLSRAKASPDEIIRYSEILAHNNNISKGEKILKTYTEHYPDDQRLWSRYGFFTMWLGKYKLAIKAFENALAIKPFFKEAQDGLDQAKGHGYIFEWTDTTARHKRNNVAKVKEYPVDKYYRIIKKNPSDDNSRFLLVDELMKVKRYEEAYQQLQALSRSHSDEQKFQALYDSVTALRENLAKQKVEEYKARIEKDPKDKEAVLALADAYSGLFDYDGAVKVLEDYLAQTENTDNPEARFKIAKYAGWNRDFGRSLEQVNFLLGKDPDNLQYQLLRAQLAVWTSQDYDVAEKYLLNVVQKEPENIDALLAFGTLRTNQDNFDEAKKYLETARAVDSSSKYVEQLSTYLSASISRAEERKIFEILEEGRKILVEKHDCAEALPKFDEYYSKAPANRLFLMEYADVYACLNNYSKAVELYTQALNDEYSFDAAYGRAKAYLWGKDSINALNEFKKLAAEAPDNFEVHMLLGDSYYAMHQYDEAREVYDSLLDKTTDSAQVALIQPRYSWLPASGFRTFFATFPNYVGIAPQYNYYSDNMNLRFQNSGGRLEVGLTGFLSAGVTFIRGSLSSKTASNNYSSFQGNLYLRLSRYMMLSGGFGNLTYRGTKNTSISDASLRFDRDSKENKIHVNGNYQRTDAGLILFSTRLIDYRTLVDMFRFQGSFQNKYGLKLSGLFDYLKLSDGNAANDLQLRLGKAFEEDITVGYEYSYTNYSRKSNYYYSPRNFESHSLWGEWMLENSQDLEVTLGAKLGYVPMSDFIMREISGMVNYKIFKSLTLMGRLNAGGTYRFDAAYNYVSGTVSAFWSF